MDKSSENPSQKEAAQPQSSRPRVRKVPATPQPGVATPSASQTAVPPSDTTTTRPTETFVRDSYLQIIKDLMGRSCPAKRVSDLLSHMPDELRREGAVPEPIPFEVPTNPATQIEAPATQHFVERRASPIPSFTGDPTINSDTDANRDAWENSRVEGKLFGEGEELEEGGDEEVKGKETEEPEKAIGDVEEEEEGHETEEDENREGPVEKNSAKKEKEIVVVEEGGSAEDEDTLDERAARRNLRTRRRLETEEPEEAAAIAAAKREAAERKRKGKQIATFIKKRQLRQSSRNIIIQEPITDLTRSPYRQAEEEEVEQAEDVMDMSESEGV